MAEPSLRSALTELLGHVQNGKEVRAYLDRFGEAAKTRFAIFKLGGAVLEYGYEELAAALSLINTVGLTPIVVHGAGPQLDREVKARGLDRGKVDGLRVTDDRIAELAGTTVMEISTALAAAIGRAGGRAVPLPPMALAADPIDEATYGRVGEPTGIAKSLIEDVVASGAIPILGSLGIDRTGRLLNINADSVARALAIDFEPLKIVFVTGTGGLLDQEGRRIPAINLDAELDGLVKDGTVHSGMKLKLEEIQKLLDPLPRSTSVSITSPRGLVRELFTHGGDGTLVRRGEIITAHTHFETLDITKLSTLIEDAFGRSLKPGYLDNLQVAKIYASADMRAAAVVIEVEGMAVLDKFAVSRGARGEGLSHALWRRMSEDFPLLFWRSRAQNGFNAFYSERADGCVRRGMWQVFWQGEIDLNTVAPAVAAIAGRPEAFEASS
ncbi:acetylglutamate kinase [Parvularcula bermudensis HTCC2503]|uniref:acetylglutamate kinase n=1 Tax=Parvularcula bermudensis (strain ATCC BAA-594 / HTCC2503 / KCTC 12087) TaxID=314260 RepID=E0THW6_PARBH|nr:acetylglutamate kinase [Parvularcula bermudensis]ADM10259.1 acetylglutamate kinase [Parvularcula bermudensis HTCC2503]